MDGQCTFILDWRMAVGSRVKVAFKTYKERSRGALFYTTYDFVGTNKYFVYCHFYEMQNVINSLI